MPMKRPSTRFVTAHGSAERWPRRTSLPSAFTEFVRSQQGKETPDADLFHDVWHGLRATLASEMKRRGLWRSPPSYLGVSGWERWDCEEPRAGALGELVADCYVFIFVDRMQGLKRQLANKPDVDGLVILNVRHFLHERQKAHDPLGFRVFELLQTAVADAIAAGSLHPLGGSDSLRHDTFLGFAPTAAPPLSPLDLGPIVGRWNDELLLGVVTARSRQVAGVVRRLGHHILELPRHGVEAFRFRDLLDPLRRDTRLRWAALSEPRSGDAALGLAAAPPESLVQNRKSLEALTHCISASIASVEGDLRTRAQLSALWQYFEGQQADGIEEEIGRGRCSYRQLGRRLNIPRDRLPVLFSILRQLVSRCQGERTSKLDARVFRRAREGWPPQR